MKNHRILLLTLLTVLTGLGGSVQAAAPKFEAAALNDLECSAKVSPYTCSIAAAELELLNARTGTLRSGPSDEELLVPAKPAAVQQQAPAPVPEPQTFVMMMLGLVLLGFASGRRDGSEKFTDAD